MTIAAKRLNFFAGLITDAEEIQPESITVDRSLQDDLSAMFEEQAAAFLNDDTTRITFNPKENYMLERGEVFKIEGFSLPSEIINAAEMGHQLEVFSLNRSPKPVVATVFATDVDAKGKLLRVLFQQFRAPQLLNRKLSLFQDGKMFNRIQNDGFCLAHELAGIWLQGTLYFRSLSIVSRFLDLSEFQPKASLEEISSFMKCDLFEIDEENQGTIFNLIEGDDFLRRRVAAIQAKNILGVIEPKKARKLAKPFDIDIELKKNAKSDSKIVLPAVKKQLKQVVKFLNEEYFHGELTQELYETNSLRRLAT